MNDDSSVQILAEEAHPLDRLDLNVSRVILGVSRATLLYSIHFVTVFYIRGKLDIC